MIFALENSFLADFDLIFWGLCCSITGACASVAQLDAHPTGDQEVAGSIPVGLATFFCRIDHEMFSTVILSLPLIQEG